MYVMIVTEVKTLDDKFEIILSKLENLEKGQQEMKQDLTIIKESVQRLEQSEPENIAGILERIEIKLNEEPTIQDATIKELTFKVENLESDLRLVKKILTN